MFATNLITLRQTSTRSLQLRRVYSPPVWSRGIRFQGVRRVAEGSTWHDSKSAALKTSGPRTDVPRATPKKGSKRRRTYENSSALPNDVRRDDSIITHESLLKISSTHPVLIIDGSNTIGHRFDDKWFSHIAAAEDFHRQLKRALEHGRQYMRKDLPQTAPQLEIVLVLEKFFQIGVKEGTLSNDKAWLRTVHSPRTTNLVPNAGDDAIVIQAEWAREAGQEVTVMTADKGLSARVVSFGCRTVEPRKFLPLLDKASKADPSDTEVFLSPLQEMIMENQHSRHAG